MTKLELFQFSSQWGLPNPSPFCFKLEAWLQLMEIPYEVKASMDPRSSPKGKFPAIRIDGESLGDSTLIIEFLKERFQKDPDKHLTAEQRAEAVAYQRLCDDHLYWVLLHSRWIDDAGWEIMGPKLAKGFPVPLKWFVPGLIRKNIKKSLHAQGIGRHTPKEIYDFGCEDVTALASRIGEGEFFFGDEVTTIDTVLLSNIGNLLWTPNEDRLTTHAKKFPALELYCQKVWVACFKDRPLPDLAKV